METSSDVVDASGNVEMSVVEVAMKVRAVTCRVKTPAPVTPSVVPGVPVAIPTEPAKMDAPVPLTLMRLATDKEVVEAMGKVEPRVVEVAMKYEDFSWFSVTRIPPMSAEPLWMASRVPGVVVAIPNKAPLVR